MTPQGVTPTAVSYGAVISVLARPGRPIPGSPVPFCKAYMAYISDMFRQKDTTKITGVYLYMHIHTHISGPYTLSYGMSFIDGYWGRVPVENVGVLVQGVHNDPV